MLVFCSLYGHIVSVKMQILHSPTVCWNFVPTYIYVKREYHDGRIHVSDSSNEAWPSAARSLLVWASHQPLVLQKSNFAAAPFITLSRFLSCIHGRVKEHTLRPSHYPSLIYCQRVMFCLSRCAVIENEHISVHTKIYFVVTPMIYVS